MDERFCQAGEIELCYETFGDPSDPALLLVMGLGTQMLGWHEDLCRTFAGRGFHVIRFDNRDCGRSTHLSHVRAPTALQLLRRDRRCAAYTLAEMAADAAGLLDALEVDAAHVCGASMGAMIAQTIAARHPERVLSLASLMGTTGHRRAGRPALRAYPVLLRRRPRDPEEWARHAARIFHVIGSRGFDHDPEELRRLARLSFERDSDPFAPARQLAAVIASGDRTAEVSRIEAPTVVIHGTRDPLVTPSGGRATARAIPGARLVEIAGMGHDLPRAAWPRIVEAVVENARRADDRVAARAA